MILYLMWYVLFFSFKGVVRLLWIRLVRLFVRFSGVFFLRLVYIKNLLLFRCVVKMGLVVSLLFKVSWVS